MIKVLFLDDEKSRWLIFHKEWNDHANIVWAKNCTEAVSLASVGEFDIMFLDHDLGWELNPDAPEKGSDGKSGEDFARWLTTSGLKVNIIFLHSMNPVGAANQHSLLKSAGYISKILQGAWKHSPSNLIITR